MSSKIVRLSEEVVNLIAAGEVIVRPANAIKELIENALDANATEIIVTVKNGGLELIKIEDNGCGIHREDMPIMCERFTTSKLSKFEDLESMQTFGFRGEALASITYMANVCIVSKTADSHCAYSGQYKDGKLIGALKASAGLNGTCVIAEDLFSNCQQRLRAFKNSSEEMNRIRDIVTRYALHNTNVSFTLRRCGSGNDFRTDGAGNLQSAINLLLGSQHSKDLILFNHADKALHFTMSGCMSQPSTSYTANRQDRSKIFYLFINKRKVDCPMLKRALDVTFGAHDQFCPFMMVSLEIEANRVDVNVHPSKSIVYFLEQDSIISSMQDYIDTLIMSSSETCCVQTVITSTNESLKSSDSTDKKRFSQMVDEKLGGPSPSPSSPNLQKPKVYPYEVTRCDAKERRLYEFVPSQSVSTEKLSCEESRVWRDFDFDSLVSLKQSVCEQSSVKLRNFFKEHIYVGAVNMDCVLLQHSTSLYSVNATECMRYFFYQVCVLSFGNLGSYKLQEKANIHELLQLADFDEAEIENAASLLVEKREMLKDYFCLLITETCELQSIPSVVDGFVPQLEGLPSLISDLVRNIDWENEKECFDGICRSLAEFFTPKAIYCCDDQFSAIDTDSIPWKDVYSNVLFPAIKCNFLPSKSLESTVHRLVGMHELYKVFERC